MTIPEQPLAVNVVEPPTQKLLFPVSIGASGIGFSLTVLVNEATLTQLLTVQIAL